MSHPAIRFIKPDVLSRISTLELLARTVVEGFVAGLHRSPYKGVSVEFMSYRPYIPGDNPLQIDWKLYARSDRLFIKEYEDETNTRFNLLVDVSPSMGYATGEVSKLNYAFYLAASLAYFANRQQDAVGLTLFDDDVVKRVPARRARGHILTLLQQMHGAELGRPTSMGKPLHQLAEMERRRGFVILISDLLDDPASIVDALKHFRFAGQNVLVFHILDPNEMQFEFTDMVEFEDMETGKTLLLDADVAKKMYQEKFNSYLETLAKHCGMLGVDYHLVTTDRPLDEALFGFLAARSKYNR